MNSNLYDKINLFKIIFLLIVEEAYTMKFIFRSITFIGTWSINEAVREDI